VQRIVNSDVAAAATLTINNTDDFIYSASLGSGANGSVSSIPTPGSTNGNNFGLTKKGAGFFTLTGNNTFYGPTKITAGILSLGNELALQGSPIDTQNSIVGDTDNGLETTVAALTFGGLTGNKNLASLFNTFSGGYSDITSLTLKPGTSAHHNYSGVIADGAAGMTLTKSGVGTQTLSGANTYTGATNVDGGTLEISGSGSINSSSAINVAGGASFIYNSSTALTVAPTLGGSAGNQARFSGSGTLSAPITLNSLDSVLAPGNSPGIQAFGIGQSWESFTYEWELNDWTDQVAGTNIDQIQIAGDLTLSGTLYALSIFSLDALNAAGLVGANGGNLFAETSNSWTILTTTGGISGFDASNWALDTSGFQDSETGTWSLASTGNDLVLSYTVIPEPSTALLAALGVLALLRRRR
jgi:autotransporter-associated beta strand protein